MAKYIDRDCSMQIIVFLRTTLTFFWPKLLYAILIMFVPYSLITRMLKIDIICSNK